MSCQTKQQTMIETNTKKKEYRKLLIINYCLEKKVFQFSLEQTKKVYKWVISNIYNMKYIIYRNTHIYQQAIYTIQVYKSSTKKFGLFLYVGKSLSKTFSVDKWYLYFRLYKYICIQYIQYKVYNICITDTLSRM